MSAYLQRVRQFYLLFDNELFLVAMEAADVDFALLLTNAGQRLPGPRLCKSMPSWDVVVLTHQRFR